LSGCSSNPKLLQTVLPFLKEPLRVGAMLESHDDVVRVADHDYVARGVDACAIA